MVDLHHSLSWGAIDLNITQRGNESGSTLVIAEAGVNHNGSLSRAKEMIDTASESGADVIKFQTFNAESLVTRSAEKADYQKKTTSQYESQFEMIKKLELNRHAHEELSTYCESKSIQFASTPFDIGSVNLLVDLNVPFLKIPSGELTNLPYLRHIGRVQKSIIMSTGMASLEEVKSAVEELISSVLEKDNLTLLHCNTEYPTPIEDVNLNAMLTIRDELGTKVGYSDHTQGIEIAVAAVALGACVIEKHFTLDRSLSGPDHIASLEPDELKNMISAIRNVEKALGNGLKTPTISEMKNIPIARKSIVAKSEIRIGEYFSEKNLTVKRPGTGIPPTKWDSIVGTKSKKKFAPDDLIQI